MAEHRWRYSRKTSGPYNAYGGFRMWREPAPEQRLEGRVVGETANAWKVRFSAASRIYLVSKKHARREESPTSPGYAIFHIPGWLWAKMNEGSK